jgi:hypothetical protein
MGESQENTHAEVLKDSGLLAEFVRKTGGNWGQAEWEDLLARIRGQNITGPPEKVGAMLELERVAYAQKIAERKDGEEATVNFDELTLRKKREYLGCEIRRRIR